MRIAILKQIAFGTVFAMGCVCLSSYILWVSLKTGLVFGKWPGQFVNKREKPLSYWVGVAIYAFMLACSLFLLIVVIKDDWLLIHWPAPQK
jgi:hydrogenase/urease accessory protein HupE